MRDGAAPSVAIDVVDTGIGIAAEHRARIFEEFFQVRAPADQPRGRGMGLGLAIVRRFADLLGHAVAVRSQPGRGSRFRVLAPRVTDLRATHAVRRRDGEDLPSVQTDATLAGATVAVVDDDPRPSTPCASSSWRGAPRSRAAATRTKRCARSASWSAIPDLIVADLRLDHGGCGLDAVAQLRDELGIAIPALVVTGDVSPEAARSVRAAGLALLPKPVVPAALAGAASVLLAHRTNDHAGAQPHGLGAIPVLR